MDPSYQTFRIIYEVTSCILCLILVRFMIKPYQATGESRYLGLPLGFGFLGITYGLAALFYFQPMFGVKTLYVDTIVRVFAYIFLSVTYFFSRKSAQKSRFLSNITLTLLIIGFAVSLSFVIIPNITLPGYDLVSAATRIINLVCIGYICAHTLRSHIEAPDPETIWITIGYIFLAVSQFSLIIWALDNSITAFFAGLAIRWAALAVFLVISYRSFYQQKALE